MDNQSNTNKTPHPLHRNVHPHLSKATLLMAVVAGIGAILLTVSSVQQQQDNRSRASEKDITHEEHVKVEKFVKNSKKGLVWDGLREPGPGSKCKGALEVEFDTKHGKKVKCTHGPDPAPDNIDVTERDGGTDPATALTTAAGASTAAATGGVVCDGDGQSGNRIQAIYARPASVPDRYSQLTANFQTWARQTDQVFYQSGLQTGEARNLRFVHDANCNVIVENVTISSSGAGNFNWMMSDMYNLGYNRTDRKYLVWTDADVYCGIGDIDWDDSPGAANRNNLGPGWARVDRGCWGLVTPVESHELMHNIGGVQNSAPHSTGGWHCKDESDRMCYEDGSAGAVMTNVCAGTEEGRFDCNKDDYFNTNPTPGSYLATFWNTANSSFLIRGAAVPTSAPTPISASTPTPTPVTADTILPVAVITAPINGVRVSGNVSITATGSDNVAVTRMEIWIDGVKKAILSRNSITYSWNTKKVRTGPHTINARAYDAVGNMGQASVGVTK